VAETFLVNHGREDGTRVVRFIGELDLASARRAKEVGLEALSLLNGDGGPLIIDVSELAFCDSSGLHAFCAIQAQAEATGHLTILRRPHPLVRRVLEMTDTLSLFVLEE
jgi:anti-anti-sigma factor